jgi:hypothetical protein
MLPDFGDVRDFADLQSRFLSSARTLMFEHELAWKDARTPPVRITSLELYLYCDAWPDRNTDKNGEQLNSGTWYVRRRGDNANTSRVDISAGDKTKGIYCGLLIRGISGVDGSGKALKRLLRPTESRSSIRWSANEIALLDEIHGSRTENGPLLVARRPNPWPGTLSVLPRVGLQYPQEPWSSPLRAVVD